MIFTEPTQTCWRLKKNNKNLQKEQTRWVPPVLYLNPLFVAASLDNPVDIDAGYVYVLFGKRSNIHHLLHLHTETWKHV